MQHKGPKLALIELNHTHHPLILSTAAKGNLEPQPRHRVFKIFTDNPNNPKILPAVLSVKNKVN